MITNLKKRNCTFTAMLLTLSVCLSLLSVTFTSCNTSVQTIQDTEQTTTITITFVDSEGKTLSTQKVYNATSNTSITFNYKKEGYNLTFYDKDDNQVKSGSFKTTTDCKIKVIQTPITYKVIFKKSTLESRTVTGTFPSEMTCTYDTEYTMPVNDLLCKDYYSVTYKCRGWSDDYLDRAKIGKYDSSSTFKNLTSIDGATITLYACFSNSDCLKVIFYFDDEFPSSSNSATLYYNQDETILESNIPSASKNGYVFEGYYLSTDTTKTKVDFSTYAITENVSFYPLFTPGTFTATFVSDHGIVPEPVSWTFDKGTSSKTDISTGEYVLTETGYTFNGWFKEGDYYKTSSIGHYNYTDLTLTAKWTPWTATLYFNKNTASTTGTTSGGTMNSISVTYETEKNLPSNNFYILGYKFTGWNTNADGTGTSYADGALYTWKGTANKASVTLFAQWEPLQTAINVSFTTPESDSDLNLSYKADTKTFTAKLQGASYFTWYLDGVKIESETGPTLSASVIPEGQHSLMVTADFNSKTYGQTATVNVTLNNAE